MLYSNLVELYEKLEGTTKRLEKTYHLSEFLKKASKEDIKILILLLQGRVFPEWDERKIGVALRLIIKSLNIATGISIEKIEENFKKTGDIGNTASNLIKGKEQKTLFSKELTIKKVFDNLQKLATMEGLGTIDKKINLIAELLTSATQDEAKYIVRTLMGELRVGLGEGTIRDAIVWAFFEKEIGFTYDKKENNFNVNDREKYNSIIETLQEGYDILNDFSDVALIAKEYGLKGFQNIKLEPGKPIKVMLAQKVKDIKEGFERVGSKCAAEYKYDGFRIQIHKNHGKIVLYTRRLENVTKQFPEVVSYIKEHVKGDSFILDSEAVGYDPKKGKYIAFQKISQRIKRKYDIDKLAKEFPVEVNIFDVVFYEGENYLKIPFKKRRELIEKIVVSPVAKKIRLAEQIVSDSEKEIDKFYKKSLEAGNEGIMMKALDAPYKPGSRVGYMVKLKPVMESLDLVIVGAEWGEGKRAEWLSSFIVACRDTETGEYLEIGRVGTGIKEKEEGGVSFMQLTEMLKPLIVYEKGKIVKVRPEIVIEINYEEIQKSPTYGSGYALRFPRLVKIREDRRPDEINSLEEIKELYYSQRGRNK